MCDGNLSALNERLHEEMMAEYNAPKCDMCGEAVWEDGIELTELGYLVHKGECLIGLISEEYSEEEVFEYFAKHKLGGVDR